MRTITIFLTFVSSLILVSCSEASRVWKTFDGKSVEGKVVGFDFARKTVTLENPQTRARKVYQTKDLDFESKRRLLFSPAFHQSYPSEGIWIREKWSLLGLAILTPVALLLTGMWLAALFIARKFNPFSAVGAFLGSWIAGVLLLVCYLVFAEKSNFGAGLIWVGVGVAALAMALFVSAVYRTSFARGALVFVGHLFFAALLAFLLLYGIDIFVPRDEVTAFWEEFVFAPTGLTEGRSGPGY